MSRFLLRSEAIASSRIEGITPSARNIALAELSQTEAVRGVSDQARLVANNLTIVSKATSALVTTDHVSVSDLTALHAALLPDQPELHGIRQRQNWIGGSSYHPLAADFVPPDASRLPELLDDIVSYLNGAAHSPLVQAALVHAQFETIHPFSDGNGRVGRALIHTVLARRGLTTAAVLPVSLVLSTLRDRYVAGLMGYRYDGPAHRPEATAGVRGWIRVFVEAALAAAQQSAQVAADIKTLRAGWQEALTAQRLAARRPPLTTHGQCRRADPDTPPKCSGAHHQHRNPDSWGQHACCFGGPHGAAPGGGADHALHRSPKDRVHGS